MELLNRLAASARKYIVSSPRRTTDTLKGILQCLAELETRAKNSLSHFLRIQESSESPSSDVYNDNIDRIVTDLQTLRAHQESIIGGLLAYWNSSEQLITIPSETTPLIDKEFPTSLTPVKSNGYVTLGVTETISKIDDLSATPTLTATSSDPDVTITYGKAYGIYIPGNESGEDGIRPDDNSGSKIIDQADSFWEAEAVTLQEEMEDDVFTPQVTNTNELSLTVNIKIPFANPTNINFVTIDPHAFSQSMYFDVTAINLIAGSKSTPAIPQPITVSRKTRITFQKTAVNAIQITLRQNKGYFMKYSLAKYRISNNEKWIDITGPHLIQRLKTYTDDINNAIATEITTAGKWINSIWVPNSPTIEEATLLTYVGDNGYFTVESGDSKRKRWAVGIQEIEFGEETYVESSEGVTYAYTMPAEATSMYLVVDEDMPAGTSINYSVSFDDGQSWYPILPINRTPILQNNGYYLPQRIYINSDLSLQRKENSMTGLNGFVNTIATEVRVMVSMARESDTPNTPIIKTVTPHFDVGEPV